MDSPKETLKQIARFVRWKDWGAGKLTILWSLCLYIAVAYAVPFGDFLLTLILFLIFASAQSALGFVLNDWGDRDLDRRQFKNNAFSGKTELESILALTLMAVMAFISGLPFLLLPGFGLLWLAWLISAASYSLEPLRLKTQGIVGLVVSFVAQWFLPVLLAFAAFQVAGGFDMWILAFALTISGATLEIGHQRFDRQRDEITHAGTFAVSLTSEQVNLIYALALVIDKVAVGLILAVVMFAMEDINTWWASVLGVSLGLIYAGLLLATLPNSLRSLRGEQFDDPYFAPGRSLSHTLHETLMNFVAPVFLAVTAALLQPLYGIILGLFLIWRVVLGGADWRLPLRMLKIRFGK